MAAELLWRCLANGAVIFAIVWVFRRRGHRAAGLLAALPVLSAPALLTLSVNHSADYAAAAAVAGLRATGLTALLVLAYGMLRRHLGAPWALLLGAACTLGAGAVSSGFGERFVPTLMLTTFVVGSARLLLPPPAPDAVVCRFLRGYLDGLVVRCIFLAVLAPTLAPLGGWLAFPLAAGAAIAVLLAVTRLRAPACRAAACPPSGCGCAASTARRHS